MSKLFDFSSLAMIPTAYKDGKLYSVRPTDGSGDFTFSRGSNLAATRISASQLIEKGRENLLLQSNNFSDSDWSKSTNITLTGGQGGYDGSSDAWEYDLSVSGAFKAISQAISHSGVHTMSVYAKANTITKMSLRSLSGTDAIVIFDLSNGTMVVGANAIEGVMTDVGNGWYRCSMIYNGSSQTTNYIYLNDISTATSGSIYIQDAQLEQGLVATDYIETGASTAQSGILEDLPRLDYSGGASCPSLLLEPQRTNLVTQSEYFGGWSQINTINTANALISPEGVQNANKLIAASGVNNNVIIQGITAGTYTASVFAKKGEFEGLVIATGTTGAFFNLNTNSFRANYASAPTIVHPVENYGNGWHRYSITFTISGNDNFYIGPNDNVSNTLGVTGNNSNGIYIYGATLEAGSYPTSYIPTYGSAVTRVNERQVGISSLPADIADTSLAHTGFIEIKANVIADGGYQVFGLDDASYSNYIKLYASNTQKSFRLLALASGVSASTGFSPDGGYSKFAWSYDGEGTMKIFMNGSLVTTASITFPTMTAFGFGERAYNQNYTSISAKQVLLFPTALTDSECIALTTI